MAFKHLYPRMTEVWSLEQYLPLSARIIDAAASTICVSWSEEFDFSS
jgi:hypothetical protein